MFVVRDACTFSGLLPDKKKCNEKEAERKKWEIEWWTTKAEYLAKIMS